MDQIRNIDLLALLFFLFALSSCERELTITHEIVPSQLVQLGNRYEGNVTPIIYKDEKILLQSNCSFHFTPFKWRADPVYIIDHIAFFDSHVRGIHLYHSPPSIKYFEDEGKLNYILSVDFKIAYGAAQVREIKGTKIRSAFVQDSLEHWMTSIKGAQDTIAFLGSGKELIDKETLILKKSYLFEHEKGGLTITAIEDYTEESLQILGHIFGKGEFQFIEENNLPNYLNL